MSERTAVPDCIFCKIASGEIPVNFIYEDDAVVAFHDASPQAPVHALVIPREHHDNLGDDVDQELMGRLFSVVPRIAEQLGVAESGYRTVVNTGPDSGQTVHHVHVHVIGGAPMGERMVKRCEA